MTNKPFSDVYKEVGSRLILEDGERKSIAPLIQRALEKGWKKITLSGSRELCKGAWFEARMAGLLVSGYTPTPKDQRELEQMMAERGKGAPKIMTGDAIASDYALRVIPKLQREYDDLRKQRARLGINTTELDHTYQLNLPSGHARDLDEQFFRAKRSLVRSIEERDFFHRVGRRTVQAVQRFEDGITRYTVSQSDREMLYRLQQNNLSRGRQS
jgi:hypothetical protein